MNRDLTTGKTGPVLWRFCLPMLGSILFQQLYNLADSFVAGKFIGEHALAAVGNSYEITLIFIAFAFGCNIGCSVVTAQLFGAKNYRDMKTAVYTTLIASGALCVALMGVGLLGSDWLLRMIHTPEEILADSRLYLNIYVCGLPFMFYYNISTGVFSALGDSRTPFLFLAASSTANIAVDILFVTAFDMGVAGVAWATFLCQGISCLLAVVAVMARLSKVPSEGKSTVFSFPLLRRVASIAIPSIMQQSFVSVGNIIIQGVINAFGTGVMAGYSAAVKLNNLVISSMVTLGNGISNFSAQNLGAKKPERIREGFFAGLAMVLALGLPMALLYFFAGSSLVAFFLENPSETAMATGIQFLRIVPPFYLIVSGKIVADGVLRGTGRMKQFLIGTIVDLVLRVALAAVLARYFGTAGIWTAWPIGWGISTVIAMAFCLSVIKQKKEPLPTVE